MRPSITLRARPSRPTSVRLSVSSMRWLSPRQRSRRRCRPSSEGPQADPDDEPSSESERNQDRAADSEAREREAVQRGVGPGKPVSPRRARCHCSSWPRARGREYPWRSARSCRRARRLRWWQPGPPTTRAVSKRTGSCCRTDVQGSSRCPLGANSVARVPGVMTSLATSERGPPKGLAKPRF